MPTPQGAQPLPGFDLDGTLPATGRLPSASPRSSPPRDRQPNTHADQEFDRHLLALSQIKGIGVHALRALIDCYGDIGLVWDDEESTLRDVLARARVSAQRSIASDIKARRGELLAEGDRARERLTKEEVHLIGMHHPAFPERLREFEDGPYWLFVEGDPAALNGSPMIAVIGTRDATHSGRSTAKRLTQYVVMNGLTLVSGLAEGIDAAAHSVAAYYSARQVAVLGTGVDVVFPASTRGIRKRIVQSGGAVISEYLPGDSYDRSRFVQRNRIQALLATAVCPVEGRARSGTAHTVRFAQRYHRTLFAVTMGHLTLENEMPKLLGERGARAYDLGSDEGVAELQTFLREIPGARWPLPTHPDPEMVFRDVLRALDDVSADLPLTPAQGRWLLQRIAGRFNLTPPAVGSTDGS